MSKDESNEQLQGQLRFQNECIDHLRRERDDAQNEIARLRDVISSLDTPHKLRCMTQFFHTAQKRKRYYRARVWFAEHSAARLRAELDAIKQDLGG